MVRRHGWAGSPPAGEQQARTRIVEAAMLRVTTSDPSQFSLSDVAADLGVTRQTVYRYYASTAELFEAVGQVAVEEFFDELAEQLAGVTEPTQWIIEALATTIEWLPGRSHLMLLLTSGRADRFTQTFSSPFAMHYGGQFLDRSDVDWAAAGYGAADRRHLVEVMLRTVQSMVINPPDPPLEGVALRRYLRQWMRPIVVAESA